MTSFRAVPALLLSLSVAACGSSSGTSDGDATDAPPEVSRIFDLNLPADFDRNALPTSAQVALDEFDRRNADAIATGGPTGNASGNALFYGTDTVGLAVEDGAGGIALVQGDVLLEMNVNSGLIDGQFQELSITDNAGNTRTLLGQVVTLESGNIVNGRFSNTLSTDPTFNITGTPASVSGSSQGAFVGDGSEALGIVNGTIAIGASSAQGFTGVYTADQQ